MSSVTHAFGPFGETDDMRLSAEGFLMNHTAWQRIPPPYPRQPKTETPDQPPSIDRDWLENLADNFIRTLNDLAQIIDNESQSVDEYTPQAQAISVTAVQVSASYQRVRITGITVTGPASTAFTLQIGSRYWELLTNAQGFFGTSKVRIDLLESDNRSLTSLTAGNWTLELTGYKINTLRYR